MLWNVFSATGPCYDPASLLFLIWSGTEPIFKLLQLPWGKQETEGPWGCNSMCLGARRKPEEPVRLAALTACAAVFFRSFISQFIH